jgi:transposase
MKGRMGGVRRGDDDYLTRDAMEQRRLDAVERIRLGVNPSRVAESLGVSRTTAYRWRTQVRQHADMHAHKATGRPLRMTREQQEIVIDLYWTLRKARKRAPITTAGFAAAVEALIGVRYHRDHMGRIMHRLGLPVKARVRREMVAGG